MDADATGLAARARARSERESENDAPAPAAARPQVAAPSNPVREENGGSFVGSIPNPFRDAPPWLQPLMIGMLALALVLLPLGALPASAIPWREAAIFVDKRRYALVGTGVGLLGALGVATLTL